MELIKYIDQQFEKMLKAIPELKQRRQEDKLKRNREKVERARAIEYDLKHLEALSYLFTQNEKGRLAEKIRQHYKASQSPLDFLSGKAHHDVNIFIVSLYHFIKKETQASDPDIYRDIADYLRHKKYDPDSVKHIVERHYKKLSDREAFVSLLEHSHKHPVKKHTTK
jgi:hypothetical protein